MKGKTGKKGEKTNSGKSKNGRDTDEGKLSSASIIDLPKKTKDELNYTVCAESRSFYSMNL
jgi:hypothetical protein